jgi:pimeloyl-ACP methyl ester carboxylesterase
MLRASLSAGFATLLPGVLSTSVEAQSDGFTQENETPRHSLGSRPSIGEMKEIDAGLLRVGYAEVGPTDGSVVVLLHGWPYDIHSFVDAAQILAVAGNRVLMPYLRGYGNTRFLSDTTPRNAQQSAMAVDVIAFMDALKIQKATLAGFDWGARTACIIAALWPERCTALVSVSGYLITNVAAGETPLPPRGELDWWYQFYFATERGRIGYAKFTRNFAELIWKTASPKWDFDNAVFEQTVTALGNPDHVDIVIHNYRWRLGLASGESRYDSFEQRLASSPTITVPTVTLEGDANGAPHPSSDTYRNRFSGRYEHRTITGGIGHNLPLEAPRAFAQAIIDISRA